MFHSVQPTSALFPLPHLCDLIPVLLQFWWKVIDMNTSLFNTASIFRNICFILDFQLLQHFPLWTCIEGRWRGLTQSIPGRPKMKLILVWNRFSTADELTLSGTVKDVNRQLWHWCRQVIQNLFWAKSSINQLPWIQKWAGTLSRVTSAHLG